MADASVWGTSTNYGPIWTTPKHKLPCSIPKLRAFLTEQPRSAFSLLLRCFGAIYRGEVPHLRCFFNSDERFGKGSVLNSLQETRKHIPTRGYVENQKIINSKVPLVMDNYVSSQGLLIFNQSWSRSFFEKKTVCKKQKSASIPEKIPICRLFRPFFPKDSSRCSVLHVKSQAALLVSSSSCFSLMRTPKDRSIPITACTSATTKGTKMPSWIYAFCMWACVNLIESRTLVCYGWSLQFIRTYSF